MNVIQKTFDFNINELTNKKVRIIGSVDKPWFCGKDVATILGYINPKCAIQQHVDIDDKLPLRSILMGGDSSTLANYNKKDLISNYINESGLYSLILRSKLDSAKKFKKWMTSEVLPSIRKSGQYKMNQEIKQLEIKIAEKDAQINRIHFLNEEYLSYKKLNEKNETIYIVSSYYYATQGIYKVGKTKKLMKVRTSGHNTTHVSGDKIKVLKEFKVNDASLVEKVIHKKLRGLLTKGDTEMFLIPYDLLENLIDVIINNDNEHNNLINSIIDTVNNLRGMAYDTTKWTTGIDMSIFNDEMRLTTTDADDNEEVHAVFNISSATEQQKKDFVAQCITAYKQTIEEPQTVVWREFTKFLVQQLQVPKYKYKALQWKPLFIEANIEINIEPNVEVNSEVNE